MGKLMALGMAGAGASAVTVGGVYMFGGGGAGTTNSNDRSEVASASNPTQGTNDQTSSGARDQITIEFDGLSAFKSGMGKHNCVKDYFGSEIKEEDTGSISTIGSNSPDSTVFFKTTPEETYGSCLSVNGKITNYGTNGKWRGRFTLL